MNARLAAVLAALSCCSVINCGHFVAVHIGSKEFTESVILGEMAARLDRPIAGLRKDDFHLFEDNVEQKIVYLSAEDAPASVSRWTTPKKWEESQLKAAEHGRPGFRAQAGQGAAAPVAGHRVVRACRNVT